MKRKYTVTNDDTGEQHEYSDFTFNLAFAIVFACGTVIGAILF